jgi:hypothetical protein
MSQKTFDPGKVVFMFLAQTAHGLAEGTFIKASRASDTYSKQVGSDGEVCRSRSRDKSGEVTLTLMQSSSFNDVLSAAAEADELAGTGVGALFIKDLRGKTLLSASNAWIRKPAEIEFAKEAGNREWVFDCADLEFVVGGAT